jgi:hypothetical protein
MNNTPIWAKLVVWGIIILFFTTIWFIVNLPGVIAFNWDWRCLVVECRILK